MGNIPSIFKVGAQSTENIAAGKLSGTCVQDRPSVRFTGEAVGRLESRKVGCGIHPGPRHQEQEPGEDSKCDDIAGREKD